MTRDLDISYNNQITYDGLKHLKNIRNGLNLSYTIADKGYKYLKLKKNDNYN